MFARVKSVRNYYEILEISNTATYEEIKKSYKKLALKLHPDKAPLTNTDPEKAEALFKELNEAYETLSNPSKRSLYNIRLNENIHNMPDTNDTQSWNAWSGFNKSQGFESQNYTSDFWGQESRSNEPTPPEPTEAERKEINDLIRNDDSRTLATYLMKYNFSSKSLLKKLLSFAAKEGSLNVVKYLVVERKMSPHLVVENSSFFFQGTIFKYAAASGNLDLVKYLLEVHNADIESQATTYSGCRGTALSYAVDKGHYHIINYLIEKGANVNPEVAYSNILNNAIGTGNVSIFKLLIESGTKLGKYHLGRAFEEGHIDIVKYILQIKPGILNHEFLNGTPGCLIIQSGNLDLLQYLEKYEALDIFLPEKYNNNINISLLSAAARSGNTDMMRYLLIDKSLLSECQKIESANKYIASMLADAVKENGFDTKKVDLQERLKLVRFLMEENKFTLPINKLIHIIHENAQFSSIEMNAYLQSHLPDLINNREILLEIASHGLEKLRIEELFRLYNLNIIRKGKYSNFAEDIHYQINKRNFSNDELKSLISNDNQFKDDALFYYCNYHCEGNLSQLQIIMESGVNINIENSHGEIAVQYAMKQGGYNDIVKLLIDNGADVYKQDRRGTSVYDILKSKKEFQDQMERISRKNTTRTDNYQSFSANNNWKPSKNNRILEISKQQTITTANKPLGLGGRIEHIAISEFEKKIGQPYLEKIDANELINLSGIHENITGNLTSQQLKKQLESILKNPGQDLVVCKINDSVGYGVFSSNDIPKDTVLCFYSGTLINSTKVNIESDHAIGYHGINASFSTKNHRGIASFFQHLPSAKKLPNAKIFSQLLQSMGQHVSEKDLKINDELYSTKFIDKNLEKSLAVENIRREFVCFNGIPIVLFVTNSNIKAGEQLGFNHGKDYWLSRNIIPELFDKSGTVIPESAYVRTFYQLKFDGCIYTGDLSPLIQQLKVGKKQIELIDDNNMTKKIDSSIVLSELLRVHGLTEDQYKSLQKSFSPFQSSSSLFETTEIQMLVKKYSLPDNSQASLEKGLRKAATNNNIDDLKKFIKLVKNINAQDTNPNVQRTALHWAAIKGHDTCYNLLLESGADRNIPDKKGETALAYLKTFIG